MEVGAHMTIGEVSKKYDISVETLRYYERIGLIPKVTRKSNGIRDYGEGDCNWVYFIKCMRSAGMSIEVLIEYVSLFQEGDETIVARKKLLIEQRDRIAEKITEMTSVLKRLDDKIEGYEDALAVFEEQLQ